MKRATVVGVLLLLACVQSRSVGLTFGADGEGLDGFLCADDAGVRVLDRLGADAGTAPASLVVDFITLGGVPGCRASQLISWCSTHDCQVAKGSRVCLNIELPTGVTGQTRPEIRTKVREALKSLKGEQVTGDAPDEFVMVRVVATKQPCSELEGVEPAAYDAKQLVGCAYSCPVLFDKIDQDVYLGFDTLVDQCDQGLRICSGKDLRWQP